MKSTPKPTIISRAESLGEPAVTSWGEQVCPVHFTVIVTPGGPGGFKEFFPTIQQRNLTIADIPQLVAAAEIGAMQITCPPLTGEEVEWLKAGEHLMYRCKRTPFPFWLPSEC
jgi:hypothetical protein